MLVLQKSILKNKSDVTFKWDNSPENQDVFSVLDITVRECRLCLIKRHHHN